MLGSLFGVHLTAASLLLRLAVGVVFTIHGYRKLKDSGKGTGEWLKGMGIPAGFGLFAGIVEFFGGIALLIGLLTQIVAVLFVLWLLGIHWLQFSKAKKKFVGGWEFDFTLLLMSLALAVMGGGLFSLDHLLRI